MFIIVVGLDEVDGQERATLEARSRIYRGVMRSHMAVYVVQEFLPKGWLAFLSKVRKPR